MFTYQDGSWEKSNDIVALFKGVIKKQQLPDHPTYGQHMEPIAIDLNYKNKNKS
jgi:hypothetical protein